VGVSGKKLYPSLRTNLWGGDKSVVEIERERVAENMLVTQLGSHHNNDINNMRKILK